MWPGSARVFGIEHDQQDARVLPFLGSLAMLNQHIAREPNQMVGVMDHISHNDTCFSPPIFEPISTRCVTFSAFVALAKGQGNAHRRLLR